MPHNQLIFGVNQTTRDHRIASNKYYKESNKNFCGDLYNVDPELPFSYFVTLKQTSFMDYSPTEVIIR